MSGFEATQVLADALQTRGDPRGTLLALELAGELATDPLEARRLAREAQHVRRLHPRLAWPPALRDASLRLRAGFAVGGEPDLDAVIAPDPLASLRWMTSGRAVGLLSPWLDRLADHGLRIERIFESSRVEGSPTASLRRVVDNGVLDRLEVLGLDQAPLDLDALASLPRLRRLDLEFECSERQLRGLAPLALEELSVAGPMAPLVPLFGQRLMSLCLRGEPGSLAPLADLHGLRSLALRELPTAARRAGLESCAGLESLDVPWLDADLLARIARLPALRELSVGALEGLDLRALVAALPRLEVLHVAGGTRRALDASPLAELESLRELSLIATDGEQPSQFCGALRLPPRLERLSLFATSDALTIHGDLIELNLYCDASMAGLERASWQMLERLTLQWLAPSPAIASLLDELSLHCPHLQRLELDPPDTHRRWTSGLEGLRRLACLRSFCMTGMSPGEAEPLAAALPEVCPLRGAQASSPPSDWPRTSAGPRTQPG